MAAKEASAAVGMAVGAMAMVHRVAVSREVVYQAVEAAAATTAVARVAPPAAAEQATEMVGLVAVQVTTGAC